MQKFSDVSRELEKRGKTNDIKRLAESRDGQKLGQMVDRKQLEKAAASGDSEAIKNIPSSILSTEEGRRLAENVRRMMEK